jgi:hypothetical protein
MNFPIYRKYATGKTFFKIKSRTEFEEVCRIGNKYTVKLFTAHILPDRVFIEDMINNYNQHWMEATNEEYESFLNFCELNLQRF